MEEIFRKIEVLLVKWTVNVNKKCSFKNGFNTRTRQYSSTCSPKGFGATFVPIFLLKQNNRYIEPSCLRMMMSTCTLYKNRQNRVATLRVGRCKMQTESGCCMVMSRLVMSFRDESFQVRDIVFQNKKNYINHKC